MSNNSAAPASAQPVAWEQAYEKARQVIAELCDGKRSWIMSIPARLDYDPDLVISEALEQMRKALTTPAAPGTEACSWCRTADHIRAVNACYLCGRVQSELPVNPTYVNAIEELIGRVEDFVFTELTVDEHEHDKVTKAIREACTQAFTNSPIAALLAAVAPASAQPVAGFDLAAFSRENRARCEAPDGFNHELSSWSLSDWMTATLGELGEAANVAKKLNRVRDGITGNKESEEELRAKLGSELADAFIYLDLTAQSQGLSLSGIVRSTFDAKSRQIGYATPAAAPGTEACAKCVEREAAFARLTPIPLSTNTELDRLSVLLFDTWRRCDPKSSVAQHPGSYIATFVDLARAVIADRANAPCPHCAAREEDSVVALAKLGLHLVDQVIDPTLNPDMEEVAQSLGLIGCVCYGDCDDNAPCKCSQEWTLEPLVESARKTLAAFDAAHAPAPAMALDSDDEDEDEPVQRNLKGELVGPDPLRDMVHAMRAVEQAHIDRPSPYYPHFSAVGCCMAGTHDEEDAERILAELEGMGHVEQIPEHEPGSYRTTESGRTWLDEQLALVGIPAFNSVEYRDAGQRGATSVVDHG